MKKVLVTGSDGQLGRCIQKIADDYPDLDFTFHSSTTLDITDVKRITSIFDAENYHHCINCAAYTNVEQAEKTPEIAFSVNAEGVYNLAKACLRNNVILIHISTDYVFDGKKESPYVSGDKTNPINEYGRSKLKGELYIQDIVKRYFIIRTSWLYSEFGKNFYTNILEKVKAGKNLKITDEQFGCPTNANNLAAYILILIQTNDSYFGLYHFTDTKAMTWYDFANQILLENGLQDAVKLDRANNYRTFAIRPKNSVLM